MSGGATDGRPFRVLGIQQVAIGGPDKARLRRLWVDMLGLEVTGHFRSERENVDEDICSMGQGPFRVEVDLMEPVDPQGKPAVHTTPLAGRYPQGRRGPRHLLPAPEGERGLPDRR
jgi:lactoylglutathione lyase